MSILKNKYEIIDDNENEGYTLPAVVRKDDRELSFEKSVVISTALHPLTVGAIWLTVFILGLLGINLWKASMPDFNKKDIEFVLVDKKDTPRDLNTKNRAEISSRSGGKRVDKKKPVSLPAAKKSPAKSSASSDLQKMVQKQQKALQQDQQKKATQPKQIKTVEQPKQDATKQFTKPSPKPPVERPTAAPSNRPVSAPKTVAPKQTTPFAVPVPSGAPRGSYLATGPVGGTGAKTGSASGGYASGSGTGTKKYAPTPSLSTYSGSGNGSSRGTVGGKGTGGYGSGGNNPGGGGGRPGIDAIREPDFGPYMRELQRRIKLNWHPPKGNESRKVVLLFKIAKNGQLLSCRVYRSSGLPSADQAALNAVKLTAPFRPLPTDYKGSNIDIQFTFDYNVFGASMSK